MSLVEDMKKRSRLRRVLLSQALGCEVNMINHVLGNSGDRINSKRRLKTESSVGDLRETSSEISSNQTRTYTDSSIFSKVFQHPQMWSTHTVFLR